MPEIEILVVIYSRK